MERITKQGTAILNAIEKAHRPLLAQEILEAAACDSPGIGQATVYRNIKALVEGGLLSTVHLPGENPRYEVSHLHHHHTFIARSAIRSMTCTIARAISNN